MTSNLFFTADYIALHARRRPDAIAVGLATGETRATFAVMARQLRQVIGALCGLGLPRGSLVAIGHEDAYLELLLILAFEVLGHVVEMFRPGTAGTAGAFTADAALVVTSGTFPAGLHSRVLRIDMAWWRAALLRPVEPGAGYAPCPALATDPMLVLHSSGTTGRPKRMLATRGMLDRRLRVRSKLLRFTRMSRSLVALSLGVAGQYYNVIACLRLGATIVLQGAETLAQTLTERGITHVTLLPLQLQQAIGAVPTTAFPCAALTLCIIGGRLSAMMRRWALDRLCGQILNVYSSNEAGTVCVVDPDGSGTLAPDVELRIVSPEGLCLPWGQAGQVHVRSAGVVAGYLGQGLAIRHVFPGGWFMSEDLGIRLPDGRLSLLGRGDDLINLGGLKIPCAEIEDRLLRELPWPEVAVFMREDHETGEILVVCVAPPMPYARDPVHKALRSMIPGSFELHFLAAIPRTPEGKIRRRSLRELTGAA